MNFKTFLKEDYVSPYLIAEIGINHNGNLNIAKKLIDASFATNWHCVKFQKRNPDKAVPDNQKNKIVGDILNKLVSQENILQNRIYLKNLINRAIKAYAG